MSITFDKDGETPLDDVSGLIPKITTRAELNDAEAINIATAYFDYLLDNSTLDDTEIDEPFLREVHHKMFDEVWTWAGTYRTTLTSIGIEANQIQQQLYKVTDDLKYALEYHDFKDVATKLHSDLVRIHPFLNGNGRWGRLVTDIWLASNGHHTLDWGKSETLVAESVERLTYIESMKAAQNGNFAPLKEFMFPEE